MEANNMKNNYINIIEKLKFGSCGVYDTQGKALNKKHGYLIGNQLHTRKIRAKEGGRNSKEFILNYGSFNQEVNNIHFIGSTFKYKNALVYNIRDEHDLKNLQIQKDEFLSIQNLNGFLTIDILKLIENQEEAKNQARKFGVSKILNLETKQEVKVLKPYKTTSKIITYNF